MILHYDYSEMMILIHSNITKEYFLEKCGAKDGIAKAMFSKMYDSVTSGLIDFKQEFDKFYGQEYESISAYLYHKYNFSHDRILSVTKAMEDNPNAILYRKNKDSYGDFQIARFMTEDPVVDRIINILLMK